MRDDGANYLQDLLIVLPEHVERVATELAALQLNPAEVRIFAGRADDVCENHANKTAAGI